MRHQPGIGVNPRKPIGPYRRVDLATADGVFQANDKHARSRLRDPAPCVQLEGVYGVSQPIKLLHDHAKIAAPVRRCQAAYVFQNEGTRSSIAHALNYVDEAEESPRFGPIHKPATLAC